MKYNQPYGVGDANASYIDKDVPGAIAGSRVPAKAVEHPQRELVALITHGGLTPSENDLAQVAKAIQTGKVAYALAGGTANALTVTLAPAPSAMTLAALPVGMRLTIRTPLRNTGAVTLDVNGLGAAQVLTAGGMALAEGDLPAQCFVTVIWGGTAWRIAGALPSAGLGRSVAIYSTAGAHSFTVPDGVHSIDYEVYGAGGGAAVSNVGGLRPEGGGGGGFAGGRIAVVPGQTISITVGAAGVTSGAGSGTGGGTSSLGAYASATGGGPGLSGGTPGAGGVGIGGQINLAGQPGGDGDALIGDYPVNGGDGAGPNGGSGAQCRGVQASWPGGGSYLALVGGSPYAGNAADGGVILRY